MYVEVNVDTTSVETYTYNMHVKVKRDCMRTLTVEVYYRTKQYHKLVCKKDTKNSKDIFSPICVSGGQTRDRKDKQIMIIAMVQWQNQNIPDIKIHHIYTHKNRK